MQRGTITILLILTVAVLAATASVFFHYANQRHAQDFWGAQTAALIDKAPKVEVMRLGEADPSMAAGEETPAADQDGQGEQGEKAAESSPAEPDGEGTPTVKAVEFNETPWLVLESRDAAPARGVSNLRRALVLDTTYNWSDVPPESEPLWQYALGVTDDRDWATVLFDFDSRCVGLAGGRRVAMLHEEAAREFKGFFEEQFAAPAGNAAAAAAASGEAKADPAAAAEPAADTAPAATP